MQFDDITCIKINKQIEKIQAKNTQNLSRKTIPNWESEKCLRGSEKCKDYGVETEAELKISDSTVLTVK